MCLEQVKRTWYTVKLLWLNMPLILYINFIRWLLRTPLVTLVLQSDYHVVCSFPLCFILLGTHGWKKQKLSLLCTGYRRNAGGMQSFLSLIVFIPELLMTHCSILEKKKVSPREKVWSTGFYPQSIVSWWWLVIFGKISQQMGMQ